MTTPSNAPESDWLTDADRALFDNARGALEALKKTFEIWIVIGKAVVRAREIADHRGGRKTFQRLLEQQGLTEIAGNDKASVSRLLQVMARLPEVEAWRATLSANQRFEWAAPNTVFKRCPIFRKTKQGDDGTADPPLSPMAKLKRQNEEMVRSIADLEERLYAAENRDGSLFDLKKDSAEHIIRVMTDLTQISADKAKKIANGILAALTTRGDKTPASQKTPVTSATPPQWVADEDGHSVAIVGKKKCRIWEDDEGQFTAEYQHGHRWREVGVFETEGEAKATCAARFG